MGWKDDFVDFECVVLLVYLCWYCFDFEVVDEFVVLVEVKVLLLCFYQFEWCVFGEDEFCSFRLVQCLGELFGIIVVEEQEFGVQGYVVEWVYLCVVGMNEFIFGVLNIGFQCDCGIKVLVVGGVCVDKFVDWFGLVDLGCCVLLQFLVKLFGFV